MGVTALNGLPVCCVIIIKGKERNFFIESGIDTTALSQVSDDIEQESFFRIIMEKEKLILVVLHVFIKESMSHTLL